MSQPIVIDLKLTGVQQVTSGLQRAQKAIQQLNGGGSGVNVANSPGLRNFTTGNARAWAWQQRQIQQQQRQYNATLRRGLRMSSPAGLGGIGEMSLISKLGIAATAVSLFSKAVEGASAAAKSFNDSMYGGIGISGKQAAGFDIGSKFSGYGAAEWQAMHDKVRNGGVAANELNRQYGYHPRSGPYGDLNPTPTQEAVIKFLRDKSVSETRKQRLLHDLGAPGLAKYENMSEDEYQRQKNAGFGTTPGQAANADSAEARLKNGFERATSMFRPGAAIMKFLDWADKVTSNWAHFAPAGAAGGAGGVRPTANTESKLEKLTQSIDKLDRSVRVNSAVLRDGKGIGGGSRAAGMPTASWAYHVAQAEAERTSLQSGAYRF